MAIRGLAVIFFLCVVVRVFSVMGGETASKTAMSQLASNDRVTRGILEFELGAGQQDDGVTLWSLLLDSSLLPISQEQAEVSEPEVLPSPSVALISEAEADTTGTDLFYTNWDLAAETPSAKPNIISSPAQATSTETIAVNNKTDYIVDTAALLKEPMNIQLSGDSPVVLVIHTHGSEAYMPDGTDQYVESDPYRTQDKSQSIIRVGDELCSELAKKGIAFIHDRNFYDYPSYNGCYSRAYDAIETYLAKYPTIKIVIDMHRDAIQAADGSVYKTIAQVGDTTCAQVLFVMGTDFSGLDHPSWKENLKLSLHIQDEMNELYPSLSKPIKLSQYRFNQQATTGSMIVEVGCTGNTLQEALTAVRYFADAFSNVALGLFQ